MNPFRDEGGSHYYRQTGEPAYETPIATGARKGEMRPTTLRDARKENLFPSITTCLKGYPKAALDAWILEQAVLARHNYPPPDDAAGPIESMATATEAQKIYLGHVKTLANAKRDAAAARGNEIHHGAEAILKGEPWNDQDPHLVALNEWIGNNVAGVYFLERSVVNLELKVAGRLDACVELVDRPGVWILDYKGRGFAHTKRHGWRAKPRKTDLIQLAFYASTMDGPPRVANLYVANDSDEPRIEFKEYSPEDQAEALEALRHVVKVWQYESGYAPQVDPDAILEAMEAKP